MSRARRLDLFRPRALVAVLAVLVGLIAVGVTPSEARAAGIASISGTLTSDTGAPIAYATIFAYRNGVFAGSASSDVTGNYSVDGLDAGSYTLNFVGPGDYLSEWWDNQPTSTRAGSFDLADGAAVVGKNAVLALGSTINGTVTGEGGVPIRSVHITAYRLNEWVGSGFTLPDGQYTVHGLPAGDYTLYFESTDDWNYLPEWWDDKPSRETAQHVTVPERSSVTGINAQLSRGATISGTVTGQGGIPLPGISVEVFGADGSYAGLGSTDNLGRYSVSRLPAGKYTMRFQTPSSSLNTLQFGSKYLSEYWNDKASPSDTITLGDQEQLSGIDAELTLGGAIEGFVTGPSGDPLEGTSVTVLVADGWVYRAAIADSYGHYSIVGLPAGSYSVSFRAATGANYAPQVWNQKPTSAGADFFDVGVGQIVTGKNATMSPGGVVSGRVTASSGEPVAGVRVETVDGGGYAMTGADGSYLLVGLESGSYRLKFVPPWKSPLAPEWWSGQTTEANAQAIDITAGTSTTNVDAILDQGASISGTVVGSDGLPARDVWVDLTTTGGPTRPSTGARTDIHGHYEFVGLVPDRYTLAFSGPDIARMWWGGHNSRATATYFDVAQAEVVPAKNVIVEAGSSIAGVMRDAAGTAITWTQGFNMGRTERVRIYDASAPVVSEDSLVYEVGLDSLGRFTAYGLGIGSYLVQFGDSSSTYSSTADPLARYEPDWYSGSSGADPRPVLISGGGQTVNGIDGELLQNLVGAGSRQTYDVSAGLGIVAPFVRSVGADGMATVATRVTSAPFARPTDSVTGQIALSRAISGGTLGGVPMRGALDFARSAIGPSTAVPGTDLTFIPFAQDAVTFAVNAASDFPRDVALGSGQQDSLVPAPFTLRNIYRGAIQSYTDSDFNSVPIRPLLPSLGNETRDFWLASLGLSDSTLGSSVVTALGASGDSATTVSGSGDVLPVSVAAYLAQGNHNSLPTSVSETRGSTELGYIGTVKPYAVANNLTTANPYFPVTRLVYTVVETDRLTGGSVDDVTLQVAFAGAGSQLCHAENTIREYGYATIGSRCGNTTSYRQGLR